VEAGFELHPRLAADCLLVTDLPLCRLLLLNDTRYPWLILVPRRAAIREIHHLNESDRHGLMNESCQLAAAMERLFQPAKLNVASLGNLVPQLHLHHIARFPHDPAWPGPVWGHSSAIPYSPEAAQAQLEQIRAVFLPINPL
jgi:diadenosine tetraphosphate (Ap4A) HIT family hydrolase